jgi:hypothetical protein
MKNWATTHELMERAEHLTLPGNACEFQLPLPEKNTPIEFNQTNSSPPPASPPLTIKNLRQLIQPLHQASSAKKFAW